MDRLEVSENSYSELEFTKRIDSEYYQKHFINLEELINKNDPSNLVSLGRFIIGPFGSSFIVDNYSEEKTYRYIRGKDVKPFFIKDDDNVYVPKKDYDRLKKYALIKNDLLLSVVGTLGNVAVVQEKELPAIFSCKSTVFRSNEIDPFFLVVYLNTKMIKDLLLRKTRGAVQTGLNLDDLKTIPIVSFSGEFVKTISNYYNTSYTLLEYAKKTYRIAENKLLTHLGLANYTPSTENTAQKSFSESFGQSGRLDAEYYQPKYEEIKQKVIEHNCFELSELVQINKSIEPGSEYYSDVGIPFYRVSNLTKFGLTDPEIKIPFDTVKNIESLFPRKNTILLSKDGSVGLAYKVQQDMEAVTSGAILHLTIKDNDQVLPDYLTLVLNSMIVQIQAERDAGGSIIQHWKPSEISKVIIPLLSMDIQREIAAKIQESFALRKRADELLEAAKRAVEIAIEQDEESAMAYLNAVTGEE